MKSFYLEFRGYWNHENLESFPNHSGIFCVYRSHYDFVNQRIQVGELLYIGESSKPRDQILDYDKRGKWESQLKGEESLAYTFAPLAGQREQAWAALVFRHKPRENHD